MTSRIITRLVMLVFVVAMAMLASGCDAVVGVGVGVGYPYGPYGRGPWGPGIGWIGGPIYP
jgi:predicted small secreted protein